MTPKDRPRPTPTPKPGDRAALVNAYRELLQTEARKKGTSAQTAPSGQRHTFLIVAAVFLLVLGTALVRMIMEEPPPPVETPAIRDASLRLLIYREALHIEAYRTANGRLPKSLAEAGGGTGPVIYQLVPPDGYSLTGTNAGIRLTYSSSEALASFLGNSYQVIKERKRP